MGWVNPENSVKPTQKTQKTQKSVLGWEIRWVWFLKMKNA